ncbi:unnamed protein product [Candida verbasci]|uniref:Chitobiosyldiphosphodolichol beta-mannosyltransferase n=1 Tax=Candida verbasci TaxID=1227364 RepID=A0A9W4TZJ1_9ASCO|nr:unnamed protein product [Candida verbasci]
MNSIEYEGFDHVWKYSVPWLYYLVALYVSLPLVAYKIFPYLFHRKRTGKKSILIFVLGDIGHSPRMCYHALSFSKLDYIVNLCGYLETRPSNEILDDVNIDIVPIKIVKNSGGLPYLLFAIRKVLIQFQQLSSIIWNNDSDYIMIQNPPCIPILFIIILYKIFINRQVKIIIDWHNLNYTILNLKFQNLKHPLVQFVKYYESFLGKFANLNLTVTKKMKEFLVDEFDFKKNKIVVLYDRPGKQFQPGKRIKHEIFEDIPKDYKILISSTSFTPDEDFNILLNALKQYEKENTPPIFLIVTGKGPLRQKFIETVESLKFSKKIIIKNVWLSSEDYPKILASGDLGVSLHTSSSGIDLPMKIVDFFGCGLPVISLKFSAIDELVKDKVNGLVVEPVEY